MIVSSGESADAEGSSNWGFLGGIAGATGAASCGASSSGGGLES